MVRLAISELTTLRWSFEEDVAHYPAAGASAIGVWRPKLADVGEKKGASLLAAAGLKASSLQWAGGFTGSDGRSHGESLGDARQAIETAAALGSGCLIIHSGARGVHTFNHARRLLRQALDKLLPFAEERNVALALEPMQGECGHEFTFLNCLDETLELVHAYKTPALRIALDTYHWGHHPQLLDRLGDLTPKLALVQLGDSRQPPSADGDRCQLGEGTIPLAQIVKRVTELGYTGYFEVELMGEEIDTTNYAAVVQRAANVFQGWVGSV